MLVPAIARPHDEGRYELVWQDIAVKEACELAELETMPVIIRNLDDDAATIIMVDSNLPSENILPSERTFAFKLKLEAIKRQGARTDLTSTQVAQKLSAEKVGDDAGYHKYLKELISTQSQCNGNRFIVPKCNDKCNDTIYRCIY